MPDSKNNPNFELAREIREAARTIADCGSYTDRLVRLRDTTVSSVVVIQTLMRTAGRLAKIARRLEGKAK